MSRAQSPNHQERQDDVELFSKGKSHENAQPQRQTVKEGKIDNRDATKNQNSKNTHKYVETAATDTALRERTCDNRNQQGQHQSMQQRIQ